ncbi:MAG: hypothetical protein CL402_07305 [Acidiferrobacteraceae bacterium]|nr:hypothetical protein [Acidiferrobacteraceae bacterium]|tara:strand:- start:34304 stop:34831 length:528 start_codon:yes stop_codon:yes gene_type:complete
MRHTEPLVDPNICYGRLDVDLDISFLQQGPKILESLPLPFDRVFTSPLKRCIRLADTLKLPYIIDARILELDFGEWEGLSWAEIGENQIDAWAADPYNFTFPKGENFASLCSRVGAFLNDLTDDKTLLISHAGVIKAIHYLVNNVSINDATILKTNYGEYRYFAIEPDQNFILDI